MEVGWRLLGHHSARLKTALDSDDKRAEATAISSRPASRSLLRRRGPHLAPAASLIFYSSMDDICSKFSATSIGKRDRSLEESPAAYKKLAAPPAARAAAPSAERPISLRLSAISLGTTASAAGHCPICRNPYIERCPHCTDSENRQRQHRPAGCGLSFGKCGCVFHTHCLEPWILRSEKCPQCDVTWESVTPSAARLNK